MLTIDQFDDDGSLYIFAYDDGVEWGIGTAQEARENAPYSNAPIKTLRFRKVA